MNKEQEEYLWNEIKKDQFFDGCINEEVEE